MERQYDCWNEAGARVVVEACLCGERVPRGHGDGVMTTSTTCSLIPSKS